MGIESTSWTFPINVVTYHFSIGKYWWKIVIKAVAWRHSVVFGCRGNSTYIIISWCRGRWNGSIRQAFTCKSILKHFMCTFDSRNRSIALRSLTIIFKYCSFNVCILICFIIFRLLIISLSFIIIFGVYIIICITSIFFIYITIRCGIRKRVFVFIGAITTWG